MASLQSGTWNQINARPLTQSTFRTTFAKVFASGVDPAFFTQVGPLGTGITYSQTGGNLVINSGTTANAELILRSADYFNGDLEFRWQALLSQRIANNNFVFELVDVIGDNLAFTINGATSVTITLDASANPFTSANVGQSIQIGAINGAAGLPGRYAIASVTSTSVTLTVASWPASGSGTCSLYGWNYARSVYSGTTATNLLFDCQRNGYNSGDTTATINTTASPGHMGIVQIAGGVASLYDQLVASATTVQTTIRASRVVNLPTETQNLYLQIRCTNGTVAPASTTALTVGMAAVYNHNAANVVVNTMRPQALGSALPVNIQQGTLPTVTTVGTVTTVTTLSTLTGGNAAEDAATTANPLITGGVVRANTAPVTLVAGDAARLTMTTGAALVQMPYSVPEANWSYVAAVGGIVNTTTAVTIATAAGASLRRYITSLQLFADTLTNATEVVIRDGAAGTVIWRHKIGTVGLQSGINITFESPLRSTANTLLEVATLTASGAGAVYVNAQGFTAA